MDSNNIINIEKVVVHESHEVCGIGAEIAFVIQEAAFKYLDAPVKRVTTRQGPVPYSKKLEQLTTPFVDRIIAAVKEVLYIH